MIVALRHRNRIDCGVKSSASISTGLKADAFGNETPEYGVHRRPRLVVSGENGNTAVFCSTYIYQNQARYCASRLKLSALNECRRRRLALALSRGKAGVVVRPHLETVSSDNWLQQAEIKEILTMLSASLSMAAAPEGDSHHGNR